jgi:hypothetical protein
MTTSTKYTKLPKSKSKNGYEYRLLDRSCKAAIYEQKVEKEINGEIGKTVGYEVFQIIIGKAYSLVQKHGKKKGDIYQYPAAEKFPGNEDFGKWAWSYTSKDCAMNKFNEIK